MKANNSFNIYHRNTVVLTVISEWEIINFIQNSLSEKQFFKSYFHKNSFGELLSILK